MNDFLKSLAFAVFAFLSLSAEECGEDHYIADSGFDLWCGDTLCNWDIESGAVERAPSWHKDDYSVAFIGDDVRISQATSRDGTRCLRFEVLADIDSRAGVSLSVDFGDDGEVEFHREFARARWERLNYLIPAPGRWDRVRFTLHKEGPGQARLAQIEATADDACN